MGKVQEKGRFSRGRSQAWEALPAFSVLPEHVTAAQPRGGGKEGDVPWPRTDWPDRRQHGQAQQQQCRQHREANPVATPFRYVNVEGR